MFSRIPTRAAALATVLLLMGAGVAASFAVADAPDPPTTDPSSVLEAEPETARPGESAQDTPTSPDPPVGLPPSDEAADTPDGFQGPPDPWDPPADDKTYVPIPNFPDLSQRHPCCLGAPVPLNGQSFVGNYVDSRGVRHVIECAQIVAADSPDGERGDYTRLLFASSARCNESAGVAIEIWAHLLDWPSGVEVADGGYQAGYGPEQYSLGEYYRRHPQQSQQIRGDVSIHLPPGGVWTNVPPACSGVNTRTVSCVQFYSPPFQTMPYPPNAGATCRTVGYRGAEAAGAGEGPADDAYQSSVGANSQGDLTADAEDATFSNEASDDDETGGDPGSAYPSNAEACTSRAGGYGTRAERSYCIHEPTVMPPAASRKRTEDCRTANSAANLAAEQARRRFGRLVADGYIGNAFQHCAWNARMVQRFDSFAKARKFADHLHESDSEPGPHLEMDLFNNGRGRSIGANATTGRGAYNECERRARIRDLRIFLGRANNYPW